MVKTDGRWVVKTSFEELKCILCENKHLFYKCGKYEEMTGTERMKLVKKEKLCFNCLKGYHNADKCISKNKCFRPGCAEHHDTLIRRTQRYACPRLQNIKQCSIRLYQLK